MAATNPATPHHASSEPVRALIQVVEVLQDWLEDRMMLAAAELGVVAMHHAVPIALGSAAALCGVGAFVFLVVSATLVLTTIVPLWVAVGTMGVVQALIAGLLAFAARRTWARALLVVEEVNDV